MAAVGAGDDEVGTRAFVVAAKQQFRVGHHDRVGVIRVGVYYRRSAVSSVPMFAEGRKRWNPAGGNKYQSPAARCRALFAEGSGPKTRDSR